MIQNMMMSHQASIAKTLQTTESFVSDTSAVHTSGVDAIVKNMSAVQNHCQDTARELRSATRNSVQQQNDLIEVRFCMYLTIVANCY